MNAAQPISVDARDHILNAEVARCVSAGYTVQSVGGGQAVLSKHKRIGWFWNTILALITSGLWLIYVVYRALNRKQDTLVISVDAYGRVTRK